MTNIQNIKQSSKNVANYALNISSYSDNEKVKIKIMCEAHDINVLHPKSSSN